MNDILFSEAHKEQLEKGLQHMGIEPSQTTVQHFIDYYNLLVKWNSIHNLTRIDTPRAVIKKHFLDSLAPLLVPELKERLLSTEQISLADIGSGAGFPGVPLKIVNPSINLKLIDSKEKTATFLMKLCALLSLERCEILRGRAEELGVSAPYAGSADFAVARAVGDISLCASLGLPWLKSGGRLIIYAGVLPDINPVVTAALDALGAREPQVHNIEIPYLHQSRHLIVIEKQ